MLASYDFCCKKVKQCWNTQSVGFCKAVHERYSTYLDVHNQTKHVSTPFLVLKILNILNIKSIVNINNFCKRNVTCNTGNNEDPIFRNQQNRWNVLSSLILIIHYGYFKCQDRKGCLPLSTPPINSFFSKMFHNQGDILRNR